MVVYDLNSLYTFICYVVTVTSICFSSVEHTILGENYVKTCIDTWYLWRYIKGYYITTENIDAGYIYLQLWMYKYIYTSYVMCAATNLITVRTGVDNSKRTNRTFYRNYIRQFSGILCNLRKHTRTHTLYYATHSANHRQI